MPELDFQITAMHIASSMTDNENFPDAAPVTKEINDLVDQFSQAIAKARNRDLYEISHKNDIRAALTEKLKELGTYLMKEAKGNQTLLISSGFPLYSGPSEVVLSKPDGFKVLPGPHSGEIILQVRRVIGAKSYLFEYTPDPLTPDSRWTTIYSTRCKTVIKDLPLGIRFLFRIAAIGSNGQMVYTEVLGRYVA